MSEVITPVRGILPDHEIRRLCVSYDMLHPTIAGKNSDQSPSHGQSSYGYDITLGNMFKTYRENRSMFNAYDVLQPGKITEDAFDTHVIHSMDDAFILQPGGFCLAHSEQTFDMPANVLGLVKDKSTYARMGVGVFNTVIEPGWRGVLTLEIVNNSNRSVALAPYRGIAQVLFYGNEPCDNDYGSGKYQGAEGLEIPK